MREKRKRKKFIRILLIVLLSLILVGALFVILMKTVFVIRYIDVTGCSNSNAADVVAAVKSEEYSDNSLILFVQLSTGKQPQIDFVESVRMTFESPWHICLKVTEKDVYGVIYESETDTCIYFNDEGIVVEISSSQAQDVMTLDGTVSGDASVGSSLPLVPEGSISYVTQVFSLIEQYELEVEKIEIDTLGYINFDTSGITVILGPNEGTSEKFRNLAQILPQLEGKSGTLDFTTFEETGDDVIFSE